MVGAVGLQGAGVVGMETPVIKGLTLHPPHLYLRTGHKMEKLRALLRKWRLARCVRWAIGAVDPDDGLDGTPVVADPDDGSDGTLVPII